MRPTLPPSSTIIRGRKRGLKYRHCLKSSTPLPCGKKYRHATARKPPPTRTPGKRPPRKSPTTITFSMWRWQTRTLKPLPGNSWPRNRKKCLTFTWKPKATSRTCLGRTTQREHRAAGNTRIMRYPRKPSLMNALPPWLRKRKNT